MKATEFEFRNRFWFIGLIFAAGFFAYNLDRVNIVEFILNRSVGNNSPSGDNLACAIFAFGSFLVLIRRVHPHLGRRLSRFRCRAGSEVAQ